MILPGQFGTKGEIIRDQGASPNMFPIAASLLTALLYMLAAVFQFRRIKRRELGPDKIVIALACAAVAMHAPAVWRDTFYDDAVHFGFFAATSMIFFIVNLGFLLALTQRPLQNLLILLFPISAVAVLLAAFKPAGGVSLTDPNPGVTLHIVSSILAYAALTLAAAQALLVALLDHQLKHKHTLGVVRVLPPLQLMESMLFELLWAGLALLTLSIGSGLLFVEDMFAQHLVHKTVLTIAAWGLFAVLLWGHHRLGWRSHTAVRLTLAGFALLMLAYFGSKFVLELVLQRP